MAKVLIVGCGDVGSRLARMLVEQGHEVHGLRRSPLTLAGVVGLTGDVTVPESLRFPAGLDYVFVLLAPGESGEAAYRCVYYDGTRNVQQALQGRSLKRLFWISSSSVYGQEDGGWVDEESPAEPGSPSARLLLQSEALAQAAPWPVTVLRFAGIYGEERLRLLRWVEAGRPVQALPPLWTNRMHVEDCAGLLAFLLARDAAGLPLAALYLGVDSAPVPQHEVLDWIADQMGLPRVAREARAGAGSNKRLSNRRILELGFQLCYPDFRAGYAKALARYRV